MAEKEFHHMGNAGFPGTDNIDVYAYENTFDYTRWQPDVTVKCCNVLWDSNYSNVPYFASDSARDTWFDALSGITETLQVETRILPDGRVKLPIPFDVMSQYNYLYCVFPVFTAADNPIAYESATNRRSRWYWFVKDVRAIAPNTTEVILDLDVWTTYGNDCTISYMMLERGHYPMAQADVSEYLEAPSSNTQWLSSPDVNYGPDAKLVASQTSIVYNTDTTYAVFCCTGHIEENVSWGTYQDETVPDNTDFLTACATHYTNQGVPSVETFAVLASDLNDFLYDIDQSYPQFKQTVQCVFFASVNMVDVGSSWTMFGHNVWTVNSSRTTKTLLQLDQESFGFASQYENICKLYTYPYSRIRIATEDGPVADVRIEDMTGSKLSAVSVLSYAWPAITLDCNIVGVNGPTQTLSFQNITERNFSMGGDWFDRLVSWDIPTFGIVQSGKLAYDVGSYYQREQAAADRDTDETNGDLQNNLTYGDISGNNGNSKRMNARERANAFNTAESNLDNIERDNALNTTLYGGSAGNRGLVPQYNYDTNNRNNDFLDTQNASNSAVDFTEASTDDFTAAANGLNNLKLNADVVTDNTFAALGTITSTNSAALTANVNGVSSIITGGIGAGTSAAATGLMAPIAAVAGIGAGIINGASTVATTNIAISKESSLTNQAISSNRTKGAFAYHFNTAMNSATKTYNDDMRKYKNQLAYDTVTQQNSTNLAKGNELYGPLADTRAASGVVKWNADQTRQVKDTIAENTHAVNAQVIDNTRDNATSRIRNARRQGRVGAPQIYGNFNPQHATTRPIGLFAELVTQPKGAIACAGDQMLRYGYMLDRVVPATDLSVMSHFTYWKASDLWVTGDTGRGVPEDAQERIKLAFLDGVTVWDNPSEIGNVSIYDNAVKEG